VRTEGAIVAFMLVYDGRSAGITDKKSGPVEPASTRPVERLPASIAGIQPVAYAPISVVIASSIASS
jgi:hypothetical protein